MIDDLSRPTFGLLLDEFPTLRIGTGPRPLLIIPGAEVGNADPGFFTRQAMQIAFRRFARDHSVYLVHRKRGMPPSYSTAEMAADYARVLGAITSQGETAHVMGFSTGGLIAQHLAAQASTLIDKLVLIVTGVRLSPEGRALVERWRELARAHRWTELNTAMSEILVTDETSKRLVRGFMRLFGGLVSTPPRYPGDFVVTMTADLAHDTSALLPTLRMPTLVLGGDRDPFFPAPLLQETAALIPNAVLSIYPNAGHGLAKTHKHRFERDVLDFLAPAPMRISDSVSE